MDIKACKKYVNKVYDMFNREHIDSFPENVITGIKEAKEDLEKEQQTSEIKNLLKRCNKLLGNIQVASKYGDTL